jgi:hypothetical protein
MDNGDTRIIVNSRWVGPALGILLIVSVFIILTWAVFTYLPIGSDWVSIYRPAALSFISGENPYGSAFVNPPWTLIPLIPFTLLPWRFAGAVLSILGLFSYAYVAYKFRATYFAFSFFLISVPVVHQLIDPGVDWLVALGFILPPQIGLFFILIKPQVGFAVALYWLGLSWQSGGIRQVLKVFLPIVVMYLLSFMVYGYHPLFGANLIDIHYNVSLWPWSIPLGIFLVVFALKSKKINWSMLASPLLSPYIAFHSFHGVFLALVRTPIFLVLAVVFVWFLRLR